MSASHSSVHLLQTSQSYLLFLVLNSGSFKSPERSLPSCFSHSLPTWFQTALYDWNSCEMLVANKMNSQNNSRSLWLWYFRHWLISLNKLDLIWLLFFLCLSQNLWMTNVWKYLDPEKIADWFILIRKTFWWIKFFRADQFVYSDLLDKKFWKIYQVLTKKILAL
jgi:hypothetical protein